MTTLDLPSEPPTAGARDRLVTTLLIVLLTAWHLFLLRPDLAWEGDDAYQYLGHARNIALGRPYADTGYIFSARAGEIGPRQYPPGLPLVMSPVYVAFGFGSLKPYMAAGLLINAAMLVVLAAWCRHGRPAVASSVVVAIFLANPTITMYSSAVIPESLYLLFTMLGLYYADRQELHPSTSRSAVLAGMFIGFAFITRSVGIALVLAVMMQTAVRRGRGWQRAALTLATTAAISVLALLLTGGDAATDYAAGLSNYDWSTPLRNARLYAGDVALELLVPVPGASHVAKIALVGFVWFAAVGLWQTGRERRGPTVWECFVAAYLAIVLAWPFYQGTRFLLPIVPFAIRAAWMGLTHVTRRPPLRAVGPLVRGVAGALILLMCVPGLVAEFQLRHTPHPGGLSTLDVRELLDFLTSRTDERSRIIVPRPRAIALFTGRAAAGWPRALDDRILSAHIREVGATHLVLDRSSRQGAELEALVSRNSDRGFERLFSNRRFVVFAAR